MIEEELTDALSNYCHLAADELNLLKEQLSRVIEAKKKLSSVSATDDQMLQQVNGLLKTVNNLQKIRDKLPPAIEEVKTLCQELHKHLSLRGRVKT